MSISPNTIPMLSLSTIFATIVPWKLSSITSLLRIPFLTLTFCFLVEIFLGEKLRLFGPFPIWDWGRPWAPLLAISDHDFVSRWRFARFCQIEQKILSLTADATATKVKYGFLHLCLLQFSGIGVNLGCHIVYSGNICDASFLNRSICCTVCAHSCTVCDWSLLFNFTQDDATLHRDLYKLLFLGMRGT